MLINGAGEPKITSNCSVSKWLQWTAIRKIGIGFPTKPKLGPNNPFYWFGVANIVPKYLTFHFLMLKRCCGPINTFHAAANLFVHIFRKYEKCWNRCIFMHFTMISMYISIDAYTLQAVSPKHVWYIVYIVEKSLTRSNSTTRLTYFIFRAQSQ